MAKHGSEWQYGYEIIVPSYLLVCIKHYQKDLPNDCINPDNYLWETIERFFEDAGVDMSVWKDKYPPDKAL